MMLRMLLTALSTAVQISRNLRVEVVGTRANTRSNTRIDVRPKVFAKQLHNDKQQLNSICRNLGANNAYNTYQQKWQWLHVHMWACEHCNSIKQMNPVQWLWCLIYKYMRPGDHFTRKMIFLIIRAHHKSKHSHAHNGCKKIFEDESNTECRYFTVCKKFKWQRKFQKRKCNKLLRAGSVHVPTHHILWSAGWNETLNKEKHSLEAKAAGTWMCLAHFIAHNFSYTDWHRANMPHGKHYSTRVCKKKKTIRRTAESKRAFRRLREISWPQIIGIRNARHNW